MLEAANINGCISHKVLHEPCFPPLHLWAACKQLRGNVYIHHMEMYFLYSLLPHRPYVSSPFPTPHTYFVWDLEAKSEKAWAVCASFLTSFHGPCETTMREPPSAFAHLSVKIYRFHWQFIGYVLPCFSLQMLLSRSKCSPPTASLLVMTLLISMKICLPYMDIYRSFHFSL